MELSLYVDGYFANPYDATCFVALTEKQLDFSITRALLRDGQGVPAGLQSRTTLARVPSLRHGEFYLTESIAIAEYLEEAFPPPTYVRLYPVELRARARARQILAYVRTDVPSLRFERPWWTTIWPATVPPLTAAAERDARELIEFTSHLATAGELATWSIAHADLALCLQRLRPTDLPLSPPARAFVDAAIARPSVRAYLDHARPPHPPP